MDIPPHDSHALLPEGPMLQQIAPRPLASQSPTVEIRPRSHQEEAVRDGIAALSVPGDDVRTQIHMACGTGKTFVSRWVSTALGSSVLLAEPSLNLIRQNLTAWQKLDRGSGVRHLVVCSDASTVRINGDEPRVEPGEIPARVTSDVSEIRRFLTEPGGPRVVVPTYHSLPLIRQAMRDQDVPRFDAVIADEAHRTATHEDSVFALIHDPEAIRSRARLYITATPRVFVDDSEEVYSMDDERTFGKVCHRLPFSKAIERKLLTDYRVVIAAISESEQESLERLNLSSPERRQAIAELALLRAAEEFSLSKVITFHGTVRRAHAFAERFSDAASRFLPERRAWAHVIDGKMPTALRGNLLKHLDEESPDTLAVIANCRCLTEGVDVPALDGIAFFDRKESEIDVVQAVGRAIRKADNKHLGTIVIPVVVPDGADADSVLDASEFRKVAQVMRALRAHDDRFEARCVRWLAGRPSKDEGEGGRPDEEAHLHMGASSLPSHIQEKLRTKVIALGAGVRGNVLTEEAVIRAAREFYAQYGKLPSSITDEPVPGMPGETWAAIDTAGRYGLRGLVKGRTLSQILLPLRVELGLNKTLTEDAIRAAAREFFRLHGKLPAQQSKEPVPGMPGETWQAIDSAGRQGYRGLAKGRTLARILDPLRVELGLDSTLTEDGIRAAAREFYRLYGKLPTAESKEPVPGMPGETWRAIFSAAKVGSRGLTKGHTVPQILEPLRRELGLDKILTEDAIRAAAREFYRVHGRLPSSITKEPVPGMPGETWKKIDSAGKHGHRGLAKGRTLSTILEPLRAELGLDNTLSEDGIKAAAREFYSLHGRLPLKDSKEPVPGMPGETWMAIDSAGRYGHRGLAKGRTLSQIVLPLRAELGLDKTLTEEGIRAAAREFFRLHGRLPVQKSKEPVPGMPGETWKRIDAAGRNGNRGLKRGRTLSKILEPLRAELFPSTGL